jgi:4-phosphopantoate--beta-alanine ligase
MAGMKIPPEHPRAKSLLIRERLVEYYNRGVVAASGLIAHGRGETFDYLLGETTTKPALKAMESAVAMLFTAKKPVISVNGNTAALVAQDIVRLARVAGAGIEVNLFYRSFDRELAIKKLLEKAGAAEVWGVGENASANIPELNSERRRVDPRGILIADVVLVPLEDGDRTEALTKMKKKVIAIDLNPLSRTAQAATITVVDNIVRAAPKIVEIARKLKKQNREKLDKIVMNFDNQRNLASSIMVMKSNLSTIGEKGLYPAREGGGNGF